MESVEYALEHFIGNNTVYILLGIMLVLFILILIIAIQGLKISKLNKEYNPSGLSEGDLSTQSIKSIVGNVENLKKSFSVLDNRVGILDKKCNNTFQNIGIVRYNAIKDMGGNMSFVIAAVDGNKNGIIINNIHSRDGNYTYIKEINRGAANVQISNEEKEALNRAFKNRIY